jgi:hypothetical protein
MRIAPATIIASLTAITGAAAQPQNLADLQQWIAQEQERTNALIAQLQRQIIRMEQEKQGQENVGQAQPRTFPDVDHK